MAVPAYYNFVEGNGASLGYTPPNVPNPSLLVFVYQEDVSSDEPVTAAHFGATAMDFLMSVASGGAANNGVDVFRLLNPGTATQTITVTGGQSGRVAIAAMTIDNTDANSFEVSERDTISDLGSYDLSITTGGADRLVLSAACYDYEYGSYTFSGCTQLLDAFRAVSRAALAYSNEATAGTVTHTLTPSSPSRYSALMFSIKPAGGGGTTIEADGALNLDHCLALSAAGPLAIEHALHLTAAEELAVEHLARLAEDGFLNNEHGGTVIRVETLPVEHLLTLAFETVIPAEHGQLVSVLQALNMEHAAVVSGAGTLAMEITAPVSVLGTLGLDHALDVSHDETVNAEHLATIHGDAILHMERAGDLLIEALGGMPIEHLATVPAEAAMNTERTLVLVTERTLPTEITAALSLSETLLTEHLETIFGDGALPAEWAQVIVIDGALNVEWDGSATFVEGIAHRFRKGRRGRVFTTKGRVRLFPGRRNRDLN